MLKVKGLEHYNGSKGVSGTYQTIINLIPPHKVYIEGFLGAGFIMRHKLQAETNVGIEINPKICRLWKAAQHHKIDVVNGSALELLKKYLQNPNAVIYLDPPYPLAWRKTPNSLYEFEMTTEEHEELLSLIGNAKAKVIISTYDNPLYDSFLKDWHKIKYYSTTHNGQAKERLFFNYEIPSILHEYTFVGKDFRDRHRIKKLIKNNIIRFQEMPPTQRAAVMAALDDEGLLKF